MVVLTCFVVCWCVCVGVECFDNIVGVLVICVLVFTAFCIVVLCFCIVSFMYLFLFVLTVLV